MILTSKLFLYPFKSVRQNQKRVAKIAPPPPPAWIGLNVQISNFKESLLWKLSKTFVN